MSHLLPAGKLPAELLARLLRDYTMNDARVVVGPRVGEDAAVIDFGDRYLIAKTDPITFATDEIGWYAVNVNANDIACTGGAPRWFLATALLPAGQTDEALAESIFAQLAGACRELGITLIGGHTEITHGIDRPIIAGLMLGETTPDALVRTGGAQPGDVLLLTKGIAVEGVSIIAREKTEELAGRFSEACIAECRDFLHTPGISVVRDAQILCEVADVHAMHDPTEGGLATALHEVAAAAEVGLVVDAERIPILPQAAALCEIFDLDPMGLIASGALLAALPAHEADRALEALEQAGITAQVIGRIEPASAGVRIRRGGVESPLPTFERDEIAKLFE